MTAPAVTTPPAAPAPRNDTPYRDPGADGAAGPGVVPADELLQQFTARYGTPQAALRAIVEENFRYRQRHREDTERMASLQVVPAGGVALTSEQKKVLDAFTALQLTPEQVTAAIKERDTLKAETAALKHAALVREAATVGHYNQAALEKVVKLDGLTLEVRDQSVEVDGKAETRRVAFAKPSGKDTFEPLDTYLDREQKDLLPALRADASRDGTGNTTGTGVQFPTQTPSTDKAPKADIVGKVLGTQFMTPGQRREAEKKKRAE